MLLTFAVSATSTTIVFILIWGVLFPMFVMGLITYAAIIGVGEGTSNDENRRYPRL